MAAQLLRPGTFAALAATELVLARQIQGGVDVEYTRRWARIVGREARLDATLEYASKVP